MNVSAKDVMKLRQMTGLGMMTCKKALIEANGDMDLAIENLRKQGEATAAKRAEKSAKEGKVGIISKDNTYVIYEVNSETDFVARNDDFKDFMDLVGKFLITEKPSSMEDALKTKSELFGGKSLEEKTLELVGKIGEKIGLKRFEILNLSNNEAAYSYTHSNDKIAVLVVVESDNPSVLSSDKAVQLGKDIAMQVTSAKPLAIDKDSMPQDVVAKEKEIYLEQVKQSGKPEKIWDKIVEGKMNKYYEQTVLLEQEFIKDDKKKVKDIISEAAKDLGASLTVKSFIRYELGEGAEDNE